MAPRNGITCPSRRPVIAASVLAADFAHLGRDSHHARDAGADLLHLDVMDGHFVPNLTMGPALCESLRAACPETEFDVHLMVTEPQQYIEPFAKAGATHLTFHLEVQQDQAMLSQQIHRQGMTVGLAINPPTDVSLLFPQVELFDLILVMSVHPGFAGQSFMPEVLEKVKQIRPHLRDDQRLAIDGGVNPTNAGLCREAGCDMLVAASGIFGADDYERAINGLRG